MPIDFDAIANAFRAPIKREMNPIVDSFKRLGDWLSQHVQQTYALELASRDYPIIRFYDEAVTAWVDESQHELLGPLEPSRSVWDTLRSAGAAFVGGLGVAGQSVREALILPRFLGMINAVLDLILNSLERFSEPTPAMFDPRQRQASDIFGEMGLSFRAFGSSLGQVREFVQGAQALRRAVSPPPSPMEQLRALARSATGNADLLAGTTGRTTAQMLDDVGRYIAGAILALPLLPDLLGNILTSAGLVFQVTVLDFCQGIESRVFRLRRRAIEFIYIGLMEFVRHTVGLVAAVDVLFMDNLRYYSAFGLSMGRAFLDNFIVYIHDLSVYFRFWTDLIESIRRTLEAFLDFDLMPVILSALLLPPSVVSALPIPRFTIGDLFDVTTDLVVLAARSALNDMLTLAEAAVVAGAVGTAISPIVPTWDPRPILRRIEALRRIVNIVVTIPRPFPAETRLPSLAGLTFPNIFNAFFGPGAPNFGLALAGMRDRLLTEIPGIFGATIGFLNNLSGVFQAAAGRAARLGSPDQYRAIAERAESLSSSIFGGQRDTLRQQIAARPPDLMAQAFESWVADGGFSLIGSVIPEYVAEMQRYWHEQSNPDRPTSPHILRRRRRMGRVQMPRLTIRAPNRALDSDLAGAVAVRFKEAIQNAYQTGRAQYEHAAA